MFNLFVARADQLSGDRFGSVTVCWCHRDDGRIQFVRQPDWFTLLNLSCCAWVIWSFYWLSQGVEPTAPVFITSAIVGLVFIFNTVLWIKGRSLVTVIAEVRGPGTYKDGQFVADE